MANLKQTFNGPLAIIRSGEPIVSVHFGPSEAESIHNVGQAIIWTALNTARLAQGFPTYPPQEMSGYEFHGADLLIQAADNNNVRLWAVNIPDVRLEELELMRSALAPAVVRLRLMTREIAGIPDNQAALNSPKDLARIAIAGGMFVLTQSENRTQMAHMSMSDLGIPLLTQS